MGVISTQGFVFRLVANDVQLDLFDDEDILISDNVTGLFDLGVLPADFTRQITIPGTKKNNAFFEHVYDISIENPFLFATNTKVPCYFDFGSFYLSNGYLQLNKVNILANKFIDSYEISVFGGLSSFARDINKNFLTNLTSLQQYNHTASYENISASWSGNLFGGDIVYPLADYGSAYRFAQGGTDLFGIDKVEGALTVQNFKPAIRIKPVLDAIFEEAGYTYTSSFMSQPFINDIYMVCNNSLRYPEFTGVDLETYGKIKVGAISGSFNPAIGGTTTDVYLLSGSGDTGYKTLPWFNELSDPQNFYQNGAYRVDKRTNLKCALNLNVAVLNGGTNNNMPISWQIRMVETGSLTPYSTQALPSFSTFFFQYQTSKATGPTNQTFELFQEFEMLDIPVGNYYFQIRQTPGNAAVVNSPERQSNPRVTMDPLGTTKSFLEVREVCQAADGRIMDIPSNMPFGTTGIKQIDFITGLQKKFNLVIYPNKTKLNEFIIEAFKDWYTQGQIKDFNRYINLDKNIECIPANNLAVNKLNFGDTLDTDYISQQFSKAANREYGKQYYIDTTNFFSQGEFNVKATFASDPLVRIPGTGLSGSVITPTESTFYAGTVLLSAASRPDIVCTSALSFDVYTTTGELTQGLIMYFDRYAQTPVTGYRTFNAGFGAETYEINSTTGEIGFGTGFFC
jgi:hypothetical protein